MPVASEAGGRITVALSPVTEKKILYRAVHRSPISGLSTFKPATLKEVNVGTH